MIIILLIASCSPERKLAKQYIRQHKGNGVMVLPLYEIYKDNLTISYDTTVMYSPSQLDSIAWAQSCFVKQTSDSVFLTLFTNALVDNLSKLGFDVYVDGNPDAFFSLPDPKWNVSIAQMQLTESYDIEQYNDYSFESGENTTVFLRFNQVQMADWLEVSRVNAETKQVLYLEGYIRDKHNTNLDLDIAEGGIGILHNRDSLQISDVYQMAVQSGRKQAEMLFDYFMNDYIRTHLPPGIIHRKYFQYNATLKQLQSGLTDRFDVVNE
jgi:hypothetical protein